MDSLRMSRSSMAKERGPQSSMALSLPNEEGPNSVMRITVVYERDRVILDLKASEKVSDVRERVREAFGIGSDEGPTGVEMQEKKILTLTYCGADLDHNWFITDVGIPSGATVKAVLRDEIKPTVYINSVFNEETIPVIQKINFRTMTVAEFRGIASRKTGLPVSVFRLLNHNGKEMFDCHSLDDYEVELGGTVTLEIWDGWTDFLNLAMMGFSSHVMDNLSHDEVVARFQMRVAMYIAAHFGHVDLAVSLLRMGVRADETIGMHPIRQWCKSSEQHVDCYKTPIHEASESGQLGVLRSFVHNNVCTVMAKDANGLTPLNIALRKKQKGCASFLLTKQWSKMGYTKKHSIPLSIYVKMKRWGERGRDKAFVIHGHWKTMVKNPRRFYQGGALVGHGVQLDGFSSSKMGSKSAATVRLEQDTDSRKSQTLWDFSDDERDSNALDPATYFRSLNQLQSTKLPKLAKWGKTLNKASKQANEKMESLSDIESCRDSVSDAGSKSRLQMRCDSAEIVDGRPIKLPPIREQKQDKNAAHLQQQPNAATKIDIDGRKTKTGKQGVLIQTGSSPPSPVKGSVSSQSTPESVNTVKDAAFKVIDVSSETPIKRKKVVKKKKKEVSLQMIHKAKSGDAAMPLPMISVDSSPRPFLSDPRIMHTTLELFQKYRGMDSRNYAIRCLSVANTFKEKPWLSQVHQAMTIATKGVRKVVERKPHLFSRLDKPISDSKAGSRMDERAMLSPSMASA